MAESDHAPSENEPQPAQPPEPPVFDEADFVLPPENTFDESDFKSPSDEVVADTDQNAGEDFASAEPAERTFDDLTLAELVDRLVRAPGMTLRALWTVANDVPATHLSPWNRPRTSDVPDPTDLALPARPSAIPLQELVRRDWVGNRLMIQLGLYIAGLILVVIGGNVWNDGDPRGRSESVQFIGGLPFVVLGMLIWGIAEIAGHWNSIQTWWQTRDTIGRIKFGLHIVALLAILLGAWRLLDARDSLIIDPSPIVGMLVLGIAFWFLTDVFVWALRRAAAGNPGLFPDGWVTAEKPKHAEETNFLPVDDFTEQLPWYMQIHPVRVFLALGGMIFTIFTWFGTSGNFMSTTIFYAWLVSVGCWSLALAPQGFNPLVWGRGWAGRMQGWKLTRSNGAVVITLVLIFMLGAYFRLHNLTGDAAVGASIPPEMTSDHVEKILDAFRVAQGSRDIFFANNGGREPFQMYAMAIFGQMPGMGFNHNTLKLLAALESILTLPLMFYLGREVIGDKNQRLGTLVGVLLAALVAVSYWHTSITRLALRIILTPFISSLLLIYLARALRRNNRADFIKAGLCLGFGLYMYQAVRMLPFVVVVALIMVIYGWATNWRERARYVVNLAVLVLISLVVFVPMFHYTLEHPEQFLRRTAGRLLGDDIITETMPDGRLIERYATFPEQIEAFNQNIPVLLGNIRNAVLMFNWKGDVAWINGYPNYPALDIFTGGLLLVGIMAWIALMVRQRDVVHWLIPVMLMIMLLPSALSIAYPIENPSFTRTSGALPAAYLIAALPLALIVERLLIAGTRWMSALLASAFAGLIVMGAYTHNADTYFNDFPQSYLVSSMPFSEAGRVLQGFAISDGSFGNAFMIAYPYWWDHRALGIAAGVPDFPNGIITRQDVPKFMQSASLKADKYRYDPERDILFFYSEEDIETDEQLKLWFPTGRSTLYPSYQPEDDFMMYRVPALGSTGFQDFLRETGIVASSP